MDGAGSWDALEWTKIEPVTRSVSHGMNKFLLEAEEVIVESEGSRKLIALGTIPLATIERFNKQVIKASYGPRQSEKTTSRRLLQVIGKDMRIIVYGFRPRTKQRRAVLESLSRCIRPKRLWDLYAFACGPSKFKSSNPKSRLLNEYLRLLGKDRSHVSGSLWEDKTLLVANKWWRISNVNSNYTMCATYPSTLIVPSCISDDEVLQASTFRARCRLPVISWCHPKTGAVVARSSQPMIGLMMNARSNADEKLVAALCAPNSGDTGYKRKLYIADARPRKNALANGAMGGGSESSSNYFQSEVVFLGIDNIHAMRDSLARLREYLDTHGAASSDGLSSFLRNGGWTWGGGNLSSMSASVSTLGDSGWLIHVHSVLAGSAWIAARVALESASVLVHCSDGWDRTSQLVSLASLLLDPYYRTFDGFQALVEKDWLAFGHPFSDRMGMPTALGTSGMNELSRQSSGGNISSSPGRGPSGSQLTSSVAGSSQAQISSNYSPIFLQWIDCISQLLRMYPCAFEFSLVFLVDFLDCMLSCRFGNFLCNSEKERQQSGVVDASGCMWVYLKDLRMSEGCFHAHYNLFYDRMGNDGPLLPPAAALAPTLWPQFHLRWACPQESQAGEIDAHYRNMAQRFTQIQKAKEQAEEKAKGVTLNMEALTTELMKEKQLRSSAMNYTAQICRENLAIKRAMQSLGCKVQFSSNGDCTLSMASLEREVRQRAIRSSPKESDGSEKLTETSIDLSVAGSIMDDKDSAIDFFKQACENLCPFRTPEGCRWPDAGCAQLGSQFVGLKANFDALDQLSIYDRYFDAES
ncbi:phosphatidylinositol-3-phosphatase myotubularin-1-like isoform X2 [Nymphaea colorata]|uniref:phosphatidylinositol-3-phosphatase myotubularin-1-like isoform X2 n=1 Tax=Nymphaea colorata TaxID=210225 RepID=UPI00129D7B27|nr:phosphatidylinositol-3-phosphatase myotubularin-1-like isoform X2 [Nymphaea colorata]